MRWSRFFIPTAKESPKDATAASHQLMLRSGMIRQLAAGIYSYLPLGYRTLRKVEAIVRQEMEAAGAIELHMPVLQPISIWDETGRVEAMGDVLLRLGGPTGDWRPATVLGPTHEEVVTEIARAFLSSYKQLPVNLFQIQTKFRGEARPKSGVLRTREFLMKDAYSFDIDKAGLDASYQKMYDAYCRIFSRCGLPYVAVEAESGPIGGDASHEFMVLTDAGEDVVAISENHDYAANTERATCHFNHRPASSPPAAEPPREVHTPGAGRVEDVCRMLGTSPMEMIKTLIFREIERPAEASARGKAPPRRRTVVALVRGDHELNEHKLAKVSGMMLELADPRTIEQLTGAEVGFAGPQGLVERMHDGDVMIIDRDVAALQTAASGANRTDYHVVGIVPGSAFPLAGARVRVADIRTVVDGDLSPTGSGSALRLRTSIEVGHVFKLGTKYSDSMKATFLGPQGKPQPFIMGCYGIGLNRIVAAAIEANHDQHGIVWPLSIAPFQAAVILLDPRDADISRAAEDIYHKLVSAGVDVILDDRDERAGFKFKDADLVGFPLRVVVGKKLRTDGHVEFSARRAPAEVQALPPDEAVKRVLAAVRS
ncbi:MAG: proline--tRNA ligase [Phycisphaerae bacterium]